jgi:hypothetical protein
LTYRGVRIFSETPLGDGEMKTRNDFHVGQEVMFGRNRGQQTRGKIVKLNPKKAKVQNLELRGYRQAATVGETWIVPYSLISAVNGEAQTETQVEASEEPLTYSPFEEDNLILEAIAGIYCNLSPENLTCDGELSRSQVTRKYNALHRKLGHLQKAVGRQVSECDSFGWLQAKTEYEQRKTR